MTRAAPLPALLCGRPFSIDEARRAGVTASRLRAKDLVVPTRGVRDAPAAPAGAPAGETPSQRMERLRVDMIARARQIAPALTSEQFFSHDVAVAVLGGPLPYTAVRRRAIDVSARRPAAQPRRAGVTGHRLQTRPPAFRVIDGLRIEDPARVWRQVARSWPLDDLIALGDYLVQPRNRLLTMDDLHAELEYSKDVGGRLLARALDEIRPGSETSEETTLRLILVRAGLPDPELNWELVDRAGRLVARLDLAYPRYRVGTESDGRVHAFDEAQFARDADRWDAIRALGWTHVRILSHHLRPDPTVALRKVTEALLDAGWRPGIA